jgi:hypothetical protein
VSVKTRQSKKSGKYVYERYRSVLKNPTKPNNEPVLRNITANHGRSVREWREAMNQFAIL